MEEQSDKEAHPTSAEMQLIVSSLENLQTGMTSMRGDLQVNMGAIADALNKLVQLETTQYHMGRAYEEVSRRLDKGEDRFEQLEHRTDVLEKDAPLQKQTTKWVLGAVGVVVTAALSMVLRFFGVF